jgi:hypothetical protein
MSDNGRDKPQRNVVKQIQDARLEAYRAYAAIRKRSIDSPYPNLAQTYDNGEPSIHTEANMKLANYLGQLGPFRASSKKWNADLGAVRLPEQIPGERKPRRGRGRGPRLRICRFPAIELASVSDIRDAINTDVYYSSEYRTGSSDGFTPRSEREKTVGVRLSEEETLTVEKDDATAFFEGAVDVDELRAIAEMSRTDDADDEFIPASRNGEYVKRFKFVFPPDQFKQILTLADDVAEGLGLLGDLDNPREHDGSGF